MKVWYKTFIVDRIKYIDFYEEVVGTEGGIYYNYYRFVVPLNKRFNPKYVFKYLITYPHITTLPDKVGTTNYFVL